MEILTGKHYDDERALFMSRDLRLEHCSFHVGESPLKESRGLQLRECLFHWRYPLWYCKNVEIERCSFFADTRAGFWYTDGLKMTDTVVDSPKNLRRCDGVELRNVRFTGGDETLWACKNVKMQGCYCKGDYFAMNSENLELENFTLVGKYSFDGVKNCVIKNSHLLTKDAFWNSENVTVIDSIISSEYIGWNSKNLTLINCTVESLQGFCYIENLTLQNCRLPNTSLAFEYCTVDAEVKGHVDSILNPISGKITVGSVGELLLEPDKIDPKATEIVITGEI